MEKDTTKKFRKAIGRGLIDSFKIKVDGDYFKIELVEIFKRIFCGGKYEILTYEYEKMYKDYIIANVKTFGTYFFARRYFRKCKQDLDNYKKGDKL